MMTRIVRSVFSVACLLSLLMVHNVTAAESNVVAQVGNVPITTYDVGREQQRLLPFNRNFHSGIPQDTLAQIQNDALNAVIERAYKINYALAEKITIDKKVIDERIDALKKKYKTTKEFNKALGKESYKDFRSAIERVMLAQKAEEVAITNKVKVSDADVLSYYEANKQMYKRPRQFKASHILISIDPSANKEERDARDKKALDLVKRAKAGEDFYNLAYYNSDDRSKYVGGDLGFFHEGQTIPEFEDAMKKLKAGEISDPVKSMYGWHIIKLVEINEPRQLELDEVKNKIRENLEGKIRTKLYSDWMDGLKTKYPVKKL